MNLHFARRGLTVTAGSSSAHKCLRLHRKAAALFEESGSALCQKRLHFALRPAARHAACLILFATAACASLHAQADYSRGGCFVVNEGWYGHSNGTVNYLSDEGEWTYRAFQNANSGRELGATTCYMAQHEGHFYIVSKQPQDPGSGVEGGRLTVCDAQTLECLAQHATLGPGGEGATSPDGHAFLGIDSRKGYVSTSNGIYPLDLETQTFGPMVEGSGAMGDDPYTLAYGGQCGRMIPAGDTVYAVHQSLGLLLIDPQTDRVARILAAPVDGSTQRGFGSIVQSKDGALWLSVTAGTSGSGNAAPYLLKLDPATGDTLRFCLPDSIYPPSNSWYAWTPDSFCASAQENALYWSGGSSSWTSGKRIFKLDIDRGEVRCLVNLEESGWQIYGCSMGIHPQTDELYLSLYHGYSDPTYIVRRYDNQGRLLQEYAMTDYYWFPGMFLFPDAEEATGLTAPQSETMSIAWDGEGLTVEQAEGVTCRIYDTNGRMVHAFRCTAESHREECALPGGLYIAVVGQGEQSAVCKFLVP